AELLRLMDATPIACGQSVITTRRSDLAGWAGYGYCPSHSRWDWGAKLLLICTCEGTVTGLAWPTLNCSANASTPGRCSKTTPPTAQRRAPPSSPTRAYLVKTPKRSSPAPAWD